MDEITSVRTFFAQRHIALNDEWEENVARYIKLNIRKVDEELESYNLPEVVYEQWLYSDLRESTRPSLNVPEKANSITLVKPALLQLMSIVDISESYYSQYRSKVVDLGKDDSEFHDPSEIPQEREKTKLGTKDINTFFVQPKKKPLLMYEFSDGNITLKAILGDSIYGLDCNTLLGAKILLIPRYICRNRVIKLTTKNCQFLGGGNERCIEESSPSLKVLCRKLNINHEEAFLKAAKSKTQLAQTMSAASIIPPQKKPEQIVSKPVQPPPSNMPVTTVLQPPPSSLPKKSENNVIIAVKPLPLQPLQIDNEGFKKSMLPIKRPHNSDFVPETPAAAYGNVQNKIQIDNEGFKKPMLPARQPIFSDFVPETPAAAYGNVSLQNKIQIDNNGFKKPMLPARQPIFNDFVPETPAAAYGNVSLQNKIQIDNDGFKKPILPIKRPHNSDFVPETPAAAYGNVSLQNKTQIDNNGFKKPILPIKRPHNSDFVPETPAAVYNEIKKPSKSLAEINLGPKKVYQSLITSSKNFQRRSIFKNELPIKTELVDVKPTPSSFKRLPAEDTVVMSDSLTDFSADNDVQMNNSNDNDESDNTGGGSSQPKENTRKSFAELLAMESDDEFMEYIQANKASQNATPLRDETLPLPFSIDRDTIPRKRLAERPKTPPLYNPRKLNFSQPAGCIPRKKNLLEAADVEHGEKRKKVVFRNPLVEKYKDLKVVKLNIVMDQKKFWLCPERRMIQPIFCDPKDEIDLKNWSLMVKISDETFGDVGMVVDKELLTYLLGYNAAHLKKAIAEKDSNELEKCREKAQNLRKIFARLDLVLEVEFSPDSSSYPVIKKINNLAKSLDVI